MDLLRLLNFLGRVMLQFMDCLEGERKIVYGIECLHISLLSSFVQNVYH